MRLYSSFIITSLLFIFFLKVIWAFVGNCDSQQSFDPTAPIPGGCLTEGTPSDSAYNHPFAYSDNSGLFSNPLFDTSKVPEKYIHLIPPDKVDVTKVKDHSKLKSEQLTYGSPPNIDKLTAKQGNELNVAERNKALQNLGMTTEEVQTNTNNQPIKIESTPNGFYIPNSIYQFSLGEVSVSGGSGIRYENNVLTIEQANTIKIKDGLLSNVSNFSGNSIEFSEHDVKNVVNECVVLGNIRDSSFIVTDDSIQINSKENVSFSIIDCSFAKSVFTSRSNASSLTIQKNESTYAFHNGTLTCIDSYGNDSLESNSNAVVNYGNNCFDCMKITPVGSYHYIDPVIEKDFSITVPKEGKQYTLCLKKNAGQSFATYDGLVDFVEKHIELKSIATYKRYALKNNKIADVLTTPVYEGKANIAGTLIYEQDFIFLKSVHVDGISALDAPLYSKSSISSYYAITEETVDGEKKRLLGLQWKNPSPTQAHFGEYQSDTTLPKIKLSTNKLIQIG